MSLRAEQLVNGERGRLAGDRKDPPRAETCRSPRIWPEGMKEQRENEEMKEAEKVRGGETDERQEPEGRLADSDTTEHDRMRRAEPVSSQASCDLSPVCCRLQMCFLFTTIPLYTLNILFSLFYPHQIFPSPNLPQQAIYQVTLKQISCLYMPLRPDPKKTEICK